jgi:GH24 family phage-related lysozyme (muramidase)
MKMTDTTRVYKEVRFAFKQGTLTRQQYRTLRGQLKAGDWKAAEEVYQAIQAAKGFETLMKRLSREG